MTSRFKISSQDPEQAKSPTTSLEEDSNKFGKHGASINTRGSDLSIDLDDKDKEPLLLPKLQAPSGSHPHPQRRPLFRRRLPSEEDDDDGDGKKKKRSFCRTWCDMWFLFSQSRVGCVLLNTFLFGGAILIILLTEYGGIRDCIELSGGVVYLYLVASLAIALGFLCCCYHFAKDNDDLPYGIFCMAYCLLFLFICVTVSGSVIVFTRIHPVGPDQPPPDMVNGTTVDVLSNCKMAELPFGILLVSYCVAIVLLLLAYCGCLLAFGSRHIDD